MELLDNKKYHRTNILFRKIIEGFASDYVIQKAIRQAGIGLS